MADTVVSIYNDGGINFTHAMPELLAETVVSNYTDGNEFHTCNAWIYGGSCISTGIDGSKNAYAWIIALHSCNKFECFFLHSICNSYTTVGTT